MTDQNGAADVTSETSTHAGLSPREKLMVYARQTIAETRGWEGELISADEVMCRFNITPELFHAMQDTRHVIAFKGAQGAAIFPAEQFVDGGVVPALDQLAAIIGPPGACWHWLVEECTALDEQRPIDALKQGRIAAVIDAAHYQYDI
jgi:hypothetical protein